MAYNSYYPVTYQPYQQPVYQQIQQPQQASIIWISGEREAQMYPVAPNNAVTLWSQTEPVVYLKQADATGKPTLKVYDLAERNQNAPNASEVKTDYVTKNELEAVTALIQAANGTISDIRADLDAMKGDVYGLAGKRKVKKVDEDAE